MTVFDERIRLLWEAMKVENIDFYLIPTADDHASEYVSDFYKVRNYYAGFTGSAGTLLIGMEMAACPELEGTRRLKQSWMMNIPKAIMEDGKMSSMPAR